MTDIESRVARLESMLLDQGYERNHVEQIDTLRKELAGLQAGIYRCGNAAGIVATEGNSVDAMMTLNKLLRYLEDEA